MQKFAIDANVFISALDEKEAHHSLSLQFFDLVRKKKYRIFAPAIMPLEVENNLRNRSKKRRIDLSKFLKNGKVRVIVVYMDEAFFRIYKKTMLSLKYTKTMDILYAAIAKHNKAPLVTWNKKDFKKYSKDIDIMNPEEFVIKYS